MYQGVLQHFSLVSSVEDYCFRVGTEAKSIGAEFYIPAAGDVA